MMCGSVAFNSNHVLMQTSEDKHAMYPDKAICEDAVLVRLGVDIWGEDCGWDPSTIPVASLWQWKEKDFKGDSQYKGNGIWEFNNYNVGEPDPAHQLIADLSDPQSWTDLTEAQRQALTDIFPGENIWLGNQAEKDKGFCGGLTQSGMQYFKYSSDCSTLIGGKFQLTTASVNDRALFSKLNSYYRVSLTTGKAINANTMANVAITLVSDNSKSAYNLIGEFNTGETSTFYVEPSATYGMGGSQDRPVGAIREVRLRVDDKVGGVSLPAGNGPTLFTVDPDWQVTQITVTDLVTHHTWSWQDASGRWVRPSAIENFTEN